MPSEKKPFIQLRSVLFIFFSSKNLLLEIWTCNSSLNLKWCLFQFSFEGAALVSTAICIINNDNNYNNNFISSHVKTVFVWDPPPISICRQFLYIKCRSVYCIKCKCKNFYVLLKYLKRSIQWGKDLIWAEITFSFRPIPILQKNF